MAVLLGAVKTDKAYLEYTVKGKKVRIYFKKATDALKVKNQMKKNIKDGFYRENITNIKVKSII
jgi:hypothetical protein